MRESKNESRRPIQTARDVAEFWNIPHLISVGNPDDWKMAFDALIKATFLLDRQNSSMVSLELNKVKLIELAEELEAESSIYFAALEKITEEFSLNLGDYIQIED